MKMAVLFGVVQMSAGIIHKGLNALYFRRLSEIIFEFIPQLLLLLSWFGLMDILIIYKWNVDWESSEVG